MNTTSMIQLYEKNCEMCKINLGRVRHNRKYCGTCRDVREQARLRNRAQRPKVPIAKKPTPGDIPNIDVEVVRKLCGDCNKFDHVNVLLDAKGKLPSTSETAIYLQKKIDELNNDMLNFERHEHEIRIYPEKKEYRIYAVYPDEEDETEDEHLAQ